ncbi:MAG: lactate utilization protein [Candidatus Omnitrophota bacterium]|jgi:hypothetical protein
MDKKIEALIENWLKRNIAGFYFRNKESAAEKILEIIPLPASVGFSGSQTLGQLGVIKSLEARGSRVFNPYKAGIDKEESLAIRRQAAQADYYLASPNSVSEKGELVFFSAYGNRTAGISYAKNVIIVAGANKITPNIQEALKRSREYATPLNCKRLKWDSACLQDGICRQEVCFSPEYKRMCCQVLIIEAEAACSRMSVVLVGESLGF